jgi:hypothetical protein
MQKPKNKQANLVIFLYLEKEQAMTHERLKKLMALYK